MGGGDVHTAALLFCLRPLLFPREWTSLSLAFRQESFHLIENKAYQYLV